jgi:hypothetical protein
MAKQADDVQALAMNRLEYLWESGHVYCEIDPVLSRSLLYVEEPFKVLGDNQDCCARRVKKSSLGLHTELFAVQLGNGQDRRAIQYQPGSEDSAAIVHLLWDAVHSRRKLLSADPARKSWPAQSEGGAGS